MWIVRTKSPKRTYNSLVFTLSGNPIESALEFERALREDEYFIMSAGLSEVRVKSEAVDTYEKESEQKTSDFPF